jgi:hypothetical protein
VFLNLYVDEQWFDAGEVSEVLQKFADNFEEKIFKKCTVKSSKVKKG